MAEFVESYGADPVMITPEHIHIIDEEKLAEAPDEGINKLLKQQFSSGAAFYGDPEQAFFIKSSGIRSLTELVNHVAHELLHIHSFRSVTVPKDEAGRKSLIKPRRSGFSITSNHEKVTYFTAIEEAIIAELTKRFLDQYVQHSSLLAEEYKDMQESLLAEEDYNPEDEFYKDVVFTLKAAGGTSEFYMNTYAGERQQLHKITQDIFEKFSDKFASAEDVFREFVKAHFSGRILTLARFTDETCKDKKMPSLKGRYLTSHLSKKKKPFRTLGDNTKKTL